MVADDGADGAVEVGEGGGDGDGNGDEDAVVGEGCWVAGVDGDADGEVGWGGGLFMFASRLWDGKGC